MNKIYKVVKNQSGTQAVASELAKGKRKGVVVSFVTMTLMTSTFFLSTNSLAANVNEGEHNKITNGEQVIAIGNQNAITNANFETLIGYNLSSSHDELYRLGGGSNTLIGSSSSIIGSTGSSHNIAMGTDITVSNSSVSQSIGFNENITNSTRSAIIGSFR